MLENITQNRLKIFIDNIESLLYSLGVARFKDIARGLFEQISRDAGDLNKANDELADLQAAYKRFRELSEAVKIKEERLRIALALTLNMSFEGNKPIDFKHNKLPEDIRIDMSIAPEDLDISKVRLWKVIREIVRQTPEIRVMDLEDALKGFGVKTSRQAIESALESHSNSFEIKRRGREKYVALKGA